MSLVAKRWLILTYCTVRKQVIEKQRKSRAVGQLRPEDLVPRLWCPSFCCPDPAWPLALPPLASVSPLRWSGDGSLRPRGGWVSLGRRSRNLQANCCLVVTQGSSQGCWGVRRGADGIVLSKQMELIFRSPCVAVKHAFSVLSPFPCRTTAATFPMGPLPPEAHYPVLEYFFFLVSKTGVRIQASHTLLARTLCQRLLDDPPLVTLS